MLTFSDMAASVLPEPNAQLPKSNAQTSGSRLKVSDEEVSLSNWISFQVVDAAMELPIVQDAASAASALVNLS